MKAPKPYIRYLLIAIGCLGAATWLYNRHHFAVTWPAQVQQQVLGTTVATRDYMISKEQDFSGFGDGFARWKYKARPSRALQELCGGAAVASCSFSRSVSPEEEVHLTVSLSGGVLTVEEWWT
jgi:hypothetical protein